MKSASGGLRPLRLCGELLFPNPDKPELNIDD
jgi:hypothetical protein